MSCFLANMGRLLQWSYQLVDVFSNPIVITHPRGEACPLVCSMLSMDVILFCVPYSARDANTWPPRVRGSCVPHDSAFGIALTEARRHGLGHRLACVYFPSSRALCRLRLHPVLLGETTRA